MIRGKQIHLRMFKASDLEEYTEAINDLSNMSPFWPAHLHSITSLKKEFEDNGFWKDDYKLMLITDKEGNLIGEIDAFKTSPNIKGPEIGYRMFQTKSMGKGFTTEALRLFSAYLYQSDPDILRLTILTRTDNTASIRVAEKCGYKKEGTLRNVWMSDGKPHSYEMLSLLRDECPNLQDLLIDT